MPEWTDMRGFPATGGPPVLEHAYTRSFTHPALSRRRTTNFKPMVLGDFVVTTNGSNTVKQYGDRVVMSMPTLAANTLNTVLMTAPPQPFTAEICFCVGAVAGTATLSGAGLTDSDGTLLHTFLVGPFANNTGEHWASLRFWTSRTATSGDNNNLALSMDLSYVWQRMVRTGGNSNWYWSGNGRDWQPHSVPDPNVISCTQIGFSATHNGLGTAQHSIYHWQVYPTDNLPLSDP